MNDIVTKQIIKYRKKYKYQLFENFEIQTAIKGYDIQTQFIKLDSNGLLTIYKGYAWDGPSGPAPDFDCLMRASLVHDALYQLMRLGLIDKIYRTDADLLFKLLSIEDHMPKIIAEIFYKILRKCSEKYTTETLERPVIISPKKGIKV